MRGVLGRLSMSARGDVTGAGGRGAWCAVLAFVMLIVGPSVEPCRAQSGGSVAWRLRVPTGAAPSPRQKHAMAYDSARGVAVLFGGLTNAGIKNDTWEWDGTAWTRRIVSGPVPSPRYGHAMAYDSARGVTVLFGGTLGSSRSGETWEWDGTAWTQRLVAGPSARASHAMAYDSARHVVVLHGGERGGIENAETWEWDGTVWTMRADGFPHGRVFHAMAYDSARSVTVLFGGIAGSTVKNDTWEWDGTAWAIRIRPGPTRRIEHAMMYDASRHVIVLFGGKNVDAYPSEETWDWNGLDWALRATDPPIDPPLARYYGGLVYDSARRVGVSFGGNPRPQVISFNDETWELGEVPSVTAQPESRATCPGGSAGFSVTAAGSEQLAYQWRKDGTPIDAGLNPSAATAMLVIGEVGPGDAGAYDCVITSVFGSATSMAASLTVCAADFNCSGMSGTDDLFAFVDAWFAQNGSAGQGFGTDINHSNNVDSDDLFAFLDLWFAENGNCP